MLKGKRINRVAVRSARVIEPFFDLPEEAPDWGTVPDEDLSISDGRHQQMRVQRQREAIPWERRIDIFAAHRFRCLYCGGIAELVIDHIVPVCSGGSARDENLAPACRPCNVRKGAAPIAAWLRSEPNLDIEAIQRRWREAGRGADLRTLE